VTPRRWPRDPAAWEGLGGRGSRLPSTRPPRRSCSPLRPARSSRTRTG